MGELAGRIALVTGASRGIGAAAARALAAAGARVIVTDVADGSDVAAEIGGVALRLDVTNEDDWIETIAFAKAELGGLDILVNNAGLLFLKAVSETTLEEWRRLQAVNVDGVFLGCKHAAPAIAERAGRWSGGGAIVNLSSALGLVGSSLSSCYCASKGAVRLMTKALAVELAPQHIRVNSVHPGVTETDMGRQAIAGMANAFGVGDNEARVQLTALHPLGCMGQDINIADAIAFLASDKAAFVTGSELVVDGGLTTQ